jgi:hypothetical protein
MILGKYALVIVAIVVAAWLLGGLLRQLRR